MLTTEDLGTPQDKEQGDSALTHSITGGLRHCCAALASRGTIQHPGTTRGVRLKSSR